MAFIFWAKTLFPCNFLLNFLLSFLLACQPKAESVSDSELVIKGAAQGTSYTVKYLGKKINNLPLRFDSLLKAIDESVSTYDTTSLITAFNKGDTILADQVFLKMVGYSKIINGQTQGAFDPTIGPLIKSWGWDFSKAESMDSTKVDSLLQLKGFDKITVENDRAFLVNPASSLNFNAIAQGYSVDLMAALLEELKIENYYIELGGELRVKGKNAKNKLWRIGIDRPEEGNEARDLIAVINLQDKSMATSGNYRKFYEKDGKRYSHTINPESGYPVQHKLLSATVVSDDCYRADALATAFMVMGLEKAKAFLRQHPEDAAFFVFAEEDGSYGFYSSPQLDEMIEKIEVKD